MAMIAPACVPQQRQLDGLECAALAYLLAPLPIFLVGWLQWPAAAFMLGLLVLSAAAVFRGCRGALYPVLGARPWALMAVTALAWVMLAGLLGPLPLNEDWGVRMTVLRDLSHGAWPVGYGPVQGGELMLRFSMGYYLAPALVGKLLGDGAAALALGLSTALGTLLFFALVIGASEARRLRMVAAWLLLLVAFSGMDIVGLWLESGSWPAYGEHIEWWAKTAQYSSQTTLLFWAPNHALPAWLITGIVWRHRDSGLALAPAALLLMAGALWSPLACVGAAPLVLWCSARRQRPVAWLREGLRLPVLAVLPGAALIATFVTLGGVQSLSGTTRELWTLFAFIPDMAEFAFIEWATLAAFTAAGMGGARRLPGYFWWSVAVLAALPLLHFGPGNDLVMRAGVAPLAMLMLAAGSVLFAHQTLLRWRASLLAVLLIGCATPALEMQRATLPGGLHWQAEGPNVADLTNRAWHYVGVLSPGWTQDLFRRPAPISSDNSGRRTDLLPTPTRP